MDLEQIRALAETYGSAVSGRGDNVRLSCPLAPVAHKHGTDRSGDLSVRVEPNGPSLCRCFACGTAGTLLYVFTEADELAGGLGASVAFIEENDKGGLGAALARLRVRRASILDPIEQEERFSDLDRYVARCSNRVPRYLIEERGVTRADVRRWRIGFDEELLRATFPCWNVEGRIVGVSRRTVLPDKDPRSKPKFFDTPGPWKGDVFYGEHAIDTTLERVHVVEGVMGTVAAARVLPNVLGMLGAHTGIEGRRLAKLRRWAREVVLVLDSDSAGGKAVYGGVDHKGRFKPGLRDQLRPHFVVKVAKLPTEHGGRAVKDPDDVPPEVLAECVRSADYLRAGDLTT